MTEEVARRLVVLFSRGRIDEMIPGKALVHEKGIPTAEVATHEADIG